MTALTQDPRLRPDSYEAVRGYVERVCFKTGPPGLVGAELEWLVVSTDDPAAPVPIDRLSQLLAAAGPPPHGSRLTFEPGGQLELSSPPYASASACWRHLTEDTDHVLAALRSAGLDVLPTALDPYRPPRRQLTLPRYEAMAAYFAGIGADCGEAMMSSTTSVQVNLDIGADAEQATRRWRLLHEVGPVLVAAFANSPVHAGRPTGWRSGRQRIWQQLDPARTAAPRGADPVAAWTDYLLDARCMLPPAGEATSTVLGAVEDRWPTYRARLDRAAGDPDRVPSVADLDLHLTTLFPPVRPRGWFEVRYLDAQPRPWWPVPVAVLFALTEDAAAGEDAAAACRSHRDWAAAARDGYALAGLATAASTVFEAAVAGLGRLAEDPALTALVEAYVERYVSQGRSPADDPIPEVQL